jgi:hypothetical protein
MTIQKGISDHRGAEDKTDGSVILRQRPDMCTRGGRLTDLTTPRKAERWRNYLPCSGAGVSNVQV